MIAIHIHTVLISSMRLLVSLHSFCSHHLLKHIDVNVEQSQRRSLWCNRSWS
ncbi:hypothetical protein KP509_02G108300 [Ceratopteris richardii]|uniref:Uncharacterized protein n=1 Tax=Ceratopteris richardii TaxID=49495 RepID=A0A8T2VKZ3_CERRI|nr:hypothetical protein KP509_02G108300 [Ceratopteris richardii]